ncbi:MAG: YfhO family protein [Lachnospiraceae bacterium]|nr:YfhO family protein [Lachnospiraceae bacterium]
MRPFAEIKKWEPNNRMQLFLLFTIVYIITALLAFFPFFLFHRSLLLNNDDGFLQHYEAIFQLKHAISQILSGKGFSFWAWNLGLGADNLGAMSYVYCDPFNYLAAAFPDPYIEIGYTVTVLVQIYALGAAFLYFGKIVNLKLSHTFWGAFAYCFSTWVITSAYRHSFFLTVAILFLFLMAGVEKVLRRQSPAVLIAATFFSAIFSLYFAYMSALILFLYLVFYYCKTDGKSLKQFFHFWGVFVLYVGIAVCMAAVIMIPLFYTLLHAVTDSADTYDALFSFNTYINYFISLAGGNEIFGQFSTVASSPLFLILLPCIIHRIGKRQATPAMLTFFCCMIFLLFPFCNSVFNGLSYPTGRWCYAATFLLIWSGLQCMEDPAFHIRTYQKAITAGLAFLGFLTLYVARVILAINWELPTLIAITNIATAFVFLHLFCTKTERRHRQTILITLTMLLNIVLVSHIRFFPGCSTQLYNFMKFGEIYDMLEQSTQKAGTEIQDEAFYRIDQADHISPEANQAIRTIHVMANETMVFQTRSLYTYLSTTTGTWFDFNRLLCNNAGYYRRVCINNNDNRTRLDFLTGTKYFLGNNPQVTPSTGAEHYASYGFNKHAVSSQGVEILKNKYALGLGCTFSSYMTEEEWLQLDYTDREQALMECVILPDSADTAMSHQSPAGISSGSRTASYCFVQSANITAGSKSINQQKQFANHGKFQVTEPNGTVTLRLQEDLSDHELYLYFKNLKRKPDSTKTLPIQTRLDKIRSRLSETDQADHGSYSIRTTMGDVTKSALNLVEDIQGFSDIEDIMVNLGQYDKKNTDIQIAFENMGSYTYDSISIMAVPVATYETAAKTCMEHTFTLDHFSDDHIKGTINTETNHSMLYLSIPYHDGWKAYVDGKETPTQKIDITFTGIPIAGSGRHQIELRYRPAGYRLGIISLILGAILCTYIGAYAAPRWNARKYGVVAHRKNEV